jgi:hypothetical protein
LERQQQAGRAGESNRSNSRRQNNWTLVHRVKKAAIKVGERENGELKAILYFLPEVSSEFPSRTRIFVNERWIWKIRSG